MRYLYQRGSGADRRVMHLARFDQFGNLSMEPICGRHTAQFNTTCNFPLGRPLCKWCRSAFAAEVDRG